MDTEIPPFRNCQMLELPSAAPVDWLSDAARDSIIAGCILGSPAARLSSADLGAAWEGWKALVDEYEAVCNALEDIAGLEMQDDDRLASSGEPASARTPLVDGVLFPVIELHQDDTLTVGRQETLHRALRGGMNRALSVQELYAVVSRSRRVITETALWSLVVDGVLAVDVTGREPNFFAPGITSSGRRRNVRQRRQTTRNCLTRTQHAQVVEAVARSLGRPGAPEEVGRASRAIAELWQQRELVLQVLSGELIMRAHQGVLYLIHPEAWSGEPSTHSSFDLRIEAALRAGASFEPAFEYVTGEATAFAIDWAIDSLCGASFADLAVRGSLGIDPTAWPIRFPAIATEENHGTDAVTLAA